MDCEKNKFIECIEIKDDNNLFDLVKGRDNIPDLREDYIFRGQGEDWPLIPSSLRIIEETNPLKKFIKDQEIDYSIYEPFINAKVIKEFLNLADKSGLKVFTNNEMREDIDLEEIYINYRGGFTANQFNTILNTISVFTNNLMDKINLNKFHKLKPVRYENSNLITEDQKKEILINELWPNSDWFEIISLAQHYGLPTCALDWSYDYKVALYFAVITCLNDEETENKNDKKSKEPCVLWAFNYKKFNSIRDLLKKDREDQFPLWCYRPSYQDNLNLNSQKGLLTFWCKLQDFGSKKSFDKIIIDNLDKYNNWCCETKRNYEIKLEDNEKLFYKFIIPTAEFKLSILDELYKDGYSEEYLFPGYEGVVKSMKNKHKLEILLSKENPNEL